MSDRDNIKAIVRVRPLLSFEDQPAWQQTGNQIKCLDTKNVRNKIGKYISSNKRQIQQQIQQYSYPFEAVINQHTSSQTLYKEQCEQIINKALKNSINCTIMAYGQTCSGKTFTTLGVDQYPGIIPCLFRHLFLEMDSPTKKTNRFSFTLSYLQLYNQNLRDLLKKGTVNKPLKIVNDEKWGTDVSDAEKIKISSYNECIKLLETGQSNRAYRAKENHDMSSRSHTLLRLYVQKWNSDYQSSSCVINIIDLAGSQRLQEGINSQTPLSETAAINKSLFQLSNVIHKLSDRKNQHIPYRDSKLTRLLQASLSGSSITMVIFCISPAAVSFSETLTTLRLAKKTKCIQLQVDTSQMNKQDSKIFQLQRKLRKKEAQCEQLKNKIQILQMELSGLKSKFKKSVPTQKIKYNVNLTILFDQQLFTIHEKYKSTSQTIFTQQTQQTKNLQEEFLEGLYHQYQQYCNRILTVLTQLDSKYNSKLTTQIKIEEICLLNMLFKKEDTNKLKGEYLRKQLRQIELQGNTNSQFYITLKQYVNTLEDINSTKRQSGFSSIQDSKQMRASNLSCISEKQNNIIECQKSFELHEQNQSYMKIYSWGYTKDYRVCTGSKIKNGIVKVHTDQCISKIVCGAHHTLYIAQNGKLFAWGKNTDNITLTSQQKAINIPVTIQIKFKVIDIAAGWAHTLALTQQGTIFSWGNGQDGQLGHGKVDNSKFPQRISHSKKIIKVYAGHSHSGFIDESQDLYTFGFNKDYRLMISEEKIVLQPKRVKLKGIKLAGFGVNHTCVITQNGEVYCGGAGTDGQLGVTLNESYQHFQQFETIQRQYQIEKKQQICPIIKMEEFTGKNRAIDVGCGEAFTVILTAKRQVYTFGKTSFNRLGHNNSYPTAILEDIDHISVGCRHGFAWNRKGKVYGWGFNMYNQLGVQNCTDLKKPQLIQSLSNLNIKQISCGYFHSAALGY